MSDNTKNKLINWLVMVLMGLTTWALVGLVQAKQDIAVLQANYSAIKDKLDTIDNKLDRYILRAK